MIFPTSCSKIRQSYPTSIVVRRITIALFWKFFINVSISFVGPSTNICSKSPKEVPKTTKQESPEAKEKLKEFQRKSKAKTKTKKKRFTNQGEAQAVDIQGKSEKIQ